MDDYESILLVKPEVFVYKVPPRATNRSYRAADWNLGEPEWTGRMRLVCRNKDCFLKLEDKTSGELFAKCPIDKYPGTAVEAVSDSSRYFVVRIQDEGGRAAFIGLGFGDRSDSFDLNVALQDHFKWVKKEEDAEKEKSSDKPGLDLGFKAGETIKINMKITKKDGQDGTAKSKPKSAATLGFLPPPPGGVKVVPPPLSGPPTPSHVPHPTSNLDLLGDILGGVNQTPPATAATDSWGEFAGAASATTPVTSNSVSNPQPSPQNNSGGNWVTF